jgi:hypothetical protein
MTAPVRRIAWPRRKRKLTSGNSQASLESAMTRLFRERPVMAGLVPAIHVFDILEKIVDARDQRGHDTWR